MRISGGAPRYAERHARRIVRGAATLGLGDLDRDSVGRALRELSAAAFPDGEGIVRLQASRDGTGRVRLVGVPRSAEPDPAVWKAVVATVPHVGAPAAAGLKVTSRLALALAADQARAAGADEALLLDPAGRLVEGARSSILVVTRGGELSMPPAERGAVAGLAAEIVLEQADVRRRDLTLGALRQAREIIATNAVRGARPITSLDGRPVGDGRPGPESERLAKLLAEAE